MITNTKAQKATFTTERKKPKTTINISRKGSIVKEKCAQLAEIASMLFPNRRLTNQDLTDLIIMYVGGDKETVRAYKGYKGRIRRSKRTGEGYIVGQTRRGYLELFGFMHRIKHDIWVIHAQTQLFSNTSECSLEENSKEKISISFSKGEGAQETRFEKVVSPNNRELTKINNNNTTEKERNFSPKIFGHMEPRELAVFDALSCEETDKAKVSWSKRGTS